MSVVVREKSLPVIIREKIASQVESTWRSELERMGPPNGWLLEHMLEWTESNFLALIKIEPTLIEMYMGVDNEGSPCRRFAIVDPKALEKEEEVPLTPEEEAALKAQEELRAANAAAAAERRAERERLREEERQREAERRKYEVMNGLGEAPAPRKLSKKEMEEMREAKNKQGKRLAKTGPRRRKYDPEAEAAAKKERDKAIAEKKAERKKLAENDVKAVKEKREHRK